MQDRYAGDVGDYVKFALLRHFATDHRLGVAWYLYPDEGQQQRRQTHLLFDRREKMASSRP